MLTILLFTVLAAAGQQPDKQLVATITGPDLKGGMVSEVTWDGGLLVLQGVFANVDGDLEAQYFIVPADRIAIQQHDRQTAASLRYWEMKSSRLSPTGLGRIEVTSDTKLPQFGVGDLARRIGDAVTMGGMQTTTTIRIGSLILHERHGIEPYDGETWSWSPPELNRVAYVDGKGDLWIASADGRRPRRLMRGDFILPAWSDDGRMIAIAERKDGGQRWEISVIHLPEELRQGR